MAVIDSGTDAVALDDTELQRDRLLIQLGAQRAYLRKMWNWYRGKQELPAVPVRYEQAYRLLINRAVTPWARLVVDSIAERLHVIGMRSATDEDAAARAWDCFMHCRMNADQRLVYTESLVGGTGYVSVSRNGDEVFMAAESGFEVTHETQPGSQRRTAAALKLYPADWTYRHWRVELFCPEATFRWEATVPKPSRSMATDTFPVDDERLGDVSWTEIEGVHNPTGQVPIVPFENRFDVLSGGESEIEDLIPILQRIDKLTLDELLTSDTAAFRQKWATGLEVPVDPKTDQPIEPFKAAVDRLWVSTKEGTRFGTFEASDLGPYLIAKDAEIAALAAISRVPSHFLMQRNLANPPTAESLIAGESGLVAKAEDHQVQLGERWEQVAALVLRFHGIDVDVADLEMQWQNAERRNPAQVADTAVKLKSVDVPLWAIWEYLGFTPEDVSRFQRDAAASELLAAALAPQVPTVAA